jgi:hypothetical protein
VGAGTWVVPADAAANTEDRPGKVSDGREQSHLLEPRHPDQRLVLHRVEATPRALAGDDFGLVQPDHALRLRITVGIPHAADGGRVAHLVQPRGETQRSVLRPVSRGDQEPPAIGAVVQGLFQGIQDQARVHGPPRPPPHDTARVHVDHQCHIDDATPGRHVREFGHPELVQTRCGELLLDQVGRLGPRIFGRKRGTRARRPEALPIPLGGPRCTALPSPRRSAAGARSSARRRPRNEPHGSSGS